jgi:hypothetical protein
MEVCNTDYRIYEYKYLNSDVSLCTGIPLRCEVSHLTGLVFDLIEVKQMKIF